MWSALLQGAGAEPTVWKMVSAFGPNWKAARDLCRRFADSTPPERDALRAARATREMHEVFVACGLRVMLGPPETHGPFERCG
jgi:hypothetical protein